MPLTALYKHSNTLPTLQAALDSYNSGHSARPAVSPHMPTS
ncbi:hypothetical protein [uncultured Hymenobacter sp.]